MMNPNHFAYSTKSVDFFATTNNDPSQPTTATGGRRVTRHSNAGSKAEAEADRHGGKVGERVGKHRFTSP